MTGMAAYLIAIAAVVLAAPPADAGPRSHAITSQQAQVNAAVSRWLAGLETRGYSADDYL